jgi:UDP-glucose 4-epimerase
MKVLVTGASGFIGGFLVETGIGKGFSVWAGVRASSSRHNLAFAGVYLIELDLSSPAELRAQLEGFKAEHGACDYIIHAAGLTKCADKNDFFRVNEEGTRLFVESLKALDMVPEKFIYLSSLSVFGPVREHLPYTPILDTDIPQPNTAYGLSKLCAEHFLMEAGVPYVIMRPTGVYGPRDRDYFKMVAGINRHVDFAVGYRPQVITFIYVKDLVKAIYLAIEKPVVNRCYFVSEPRGYGSRCFSEYIQAALGKRFVLHFKAPLWMLKAVSASAGVLAGLFGKASTLNSDKYWIMKQRNWLCDTRPIEKELGFRVDYPLERGVNEMVEWYKKENWI